MGRMLLLGCALLLSLLSPTVRAAEEGEKTYHCWRFEKDTDALWRMESIPVDAHNAHEAIAQCAEIVKDRISRQNRRIVRT